jgi:hypothetical protein
MSLVSVTTLSIRQGSLVNVLFSVATPGDSLLVGSETGADPHASAMGSCRVLI